MAQSDALKKYLDAGMAFTQLTRARAEQVVKDLVAAGELQRSQAKSAIDELLERSRKNAETLAEQVRKEVDEQLAGLGLARKADVEKLEAELDRLRSGRQDGDGGSPAAPGPVKKKAAAKPAGGKEAGGAGATLDHSTPAKKVAAKSGAKKAAPTEPEQGGGGDKGGDQGDGGGPAPSKAAPAKATKESGKAAPAKSTKKAASSATSPVGTELPGRKENDRGDEAKPAPAKKTAKKGGDQGAPPSDRSTPAKKAGKKQG